jgi:hypothetical protein
MVGSASPMASRSLGVKREGDGTFLDDGSNVRLWAPRFHRRKLKDQRSSNRTPMKFLKK